MDGPAAEALRERLVAELVANGHLPSQRWRDAFRQVPRHEFVPRFFRQLPAGEYQAVDRADPDWLETIYTDDVLTTQLDGDDGMWENALASPVTADATSSSSQPRLMADMLEALDVHDGHRVLEVGTGTGFNAALLAHRLGSDHITTVDVDAGIITRAERVLHRCGYTPTVAAVDGLDGYPPGAPYDRIIATCSVTAVPAAWIVQTRAGGLILTSLYRELPGGALVRLRVDSEGAARGHFLATFGGFMPARVEHYQAALPMLRAALRTKADDPREPTTISADTLRHPDFGMVAAALMPGVTSIRFAPEGGLQFWLLASDGSWACLEENGGTVTQHGPRRLWDRIEKEYAAWQAAGRPARDRYGLTVTPDRQYLWLDEPDGTYSRPMPS